MAKSQRGHATARLVSLGLPKNVAVAILSQVENWERQSGPEWTVDRLKSLKIAYLHRLNGGHWKPDWVAWRGDAPKGVFRPLFHQPSHKKAIKALNVLMIYSSYVAPSATPRQVAKFVGSVVDPPPSQGNLPEEIVASVPMPRTSRKAWAVHLESFPPSPERKTSAFGRSVDQTDSRSLDMVIREARCLGIIDLYPKVTAELRDVIMTQPWLSNPGERPTFGKVSFIQEPGYKLRAVANPNLMVQVALRPLQQVIWELLRHMPEDATFDQEAGVLTVLGWLQEGETVHSVDLSDATNVFPLELQMSLLKLALTDGSWSEHLSLFHHASTGRWAYKDPLTGRSSCIQWKKGQPLGLAPSFGAFAYAHHFVARLAKKRAGSGDYRLLGDDIVIVGDDMVREYRVLLNQLGCPVSESKTLSGQVAEFAGKIVTRDGVITTGKWRDISDANFIELARSLGPRSRPMFRPRQRKVLSRVGELPEFLGGAGWNPNGKPLEDRLLGFEPLLLLEGETEFTVTRLSWFSEYMWSRQVKPMTRYTPPRPEEVRTFKGHRNGDPMVGYQTVIDTIRPLTESAPEGVNLPGYGPAAALPQHTVANLIRWERILSSLPDGDLGTLRSVADTA